MSSQYFKPQLNYDKKFILSHILSHGNHSRIIIVNNFWNYDKNHHKSKNSHKTIKNVDRQHKETVSVISATTL